jgi:prepilin-type N-terminal cleavage/methylation domain-containing protein
MKKIQQGFTLIELITTISIIIILAGITYVSLNPAKRQRNARNAKRWGDVNSILNAIARYQIDNNGDTSGLGLPGDANYYILGTDVSGCDLTGSSRCRNLAADTQPACNNTLSNLSDYLDSAPVDPLGSRGTRGIAWDSGRTGYWINYDATTGKIEIGACDSEDPDGGSSYADIKASIL